MLSVLRALCKLAVAYLLLSSVHLIPSSQNLVVDLDWSCVRTQVTLDMVARTRREQEEGGQRSLWCIGILLLLRSLLLVFAAWSVSVHARYCEAGIRKVLGQLVGVENRLTLARRAEERVGMRHVGTDESADGAIELGEASYHCMLWLAQRVKRREIARILLSRQDTR